MVKEKYAKSYVEVLELLKYIPQEEYDKIPQEKIDFFEKNKDTSYIFNIDEEIPLEDQTISIEANSIMIILFRDYLATDKQKEILKNLLEQNDAKYQQNLNEQYNTDNLFKKINTKKEKIEIDNNTEIKLPVTVKKKNFFEKIIDKIKNFFTNKS